MRINVEDQGWRYDANSENAQSIAIQVDFEGGQPNHFGAPRAKRRALKLGGFVGRTKLDGSCNVDVLDITPHCNGTHTESIAHIVNEEIWVGHITPPVLTPALLMTAPITKVAETNETYRPKLDDADAVITAASLRNVFRRFKFESPPALILRTKPNADNKRTRAYAEGEPPAFLTVEAMQFVVETGCRHLLVDLPSIDRMYDDGLLTNHHLFWNVPEGSHSISAESWQDKTITEMVYVANETPDGAYLLSLQFPALCSDAAPSRPVIMPARRTKI